jgi:hypothetical protein
MSRQTNDFIIEEFDGMGTDCRQYWDSEKQMFVELSQADIYKDVETANEEVAKTEGRGFVRVLTDLEMAIFYEDL